MSPSYTDALVAPTSGEVIAMSAIPDPVFSSGALGEGFGVIPTSGDIVAPVSGVVTMVAGTGHALGFQTDDGLEVLLHLGVDTVELNGAPFALTPASGDRVEAGQAIGTMDIDQIVAAGKETTAIVAITNSATTLEGLDVELGPIQAGQQVALGHRIAAGADEGAAAGTADAGDAGQPLLAPVTGELIAISAIADPVFFSGALGEGFGVQPSSGDVVAPVSGVVTMVAATGHALGFQTDDGLEVLLHLGVDTVELNGAPFALTPASGDRVEAGQPIGTMDLQQIVDAGKETTAIVAITNSAKTLEGLDLTTGHVEAGGEAGRARRKTTSPAPAGAGAAGATAAEGAAADGHDPVTDPTAHALSPDDRIAVQSGGGAAPDDGLTGFDATARDILAGIGGPQNVKNVIHCITRVRFYLKDDSIPDDAAVADIDGVIDVARAGGQYQVVIGPEVVDVYDAVVKQLPSSNQGGEAFPDDEPVEKRTTVGGWIKYGFSELIGVITGSMIPVVGVLAASGILKGVLALLTQFNAVDSGSPTYTFIAAMADSMFYFLPIIIGFTAPKRLGADPGYSPLNAIVCSSMIAQGGGALAVWVKVKNAKIKRMAAPATISALCGVTEPAMYGLNLKYGRVFITASIGGAVGGLLTGLFDVNMWGFTGGFVGFPSFVNPDGIDSSFVGYWIASIAALVVSFTCTYFFGFTEKDFDAERSVKKVHLGSREPVAR